MKKHVKNGLVCNRIERVAGQVQENVWICQANDDAPFIFDGTRNAIYITMELFNPDDIKSILSAVVGNKLGGMDSTKCIIKIDDACFLDLDVYIKYLEKTDDDKDAERAINELRNQKAYILKEAAKVLK